MIYVIFILCLILFVIAIYVLRKLSKQYKTLQEIYYLQKLMLSHSQFTNDANEMILSLIPQHYYKIFFLST